MGKDTVFLEKAEGEVPKLPRLEAIDALPGFEVALEVGLVTDAIPHHFVAGVEAAFTAEPAGGIIAIIAHGWLQLFQFCCERIDQGIALIAKRTVLACYPQGMDDSLAFCLGQTDQLAGQSLFLRHVRAPKKSLLQSLKTGFIRFPPIAQETMKNNTHNTTGQEGGTPIPLTLLAGQNCLIGYARVSTEEQILDVQLNALTAAGCLSVYQEKVSGAGKKRPQLDLAIKELQEGDTLVVWRLDRLARSVDEFYHRLAQIREAKATFKSLSENFDFGTAMGEFVLVILAAVAQLERQLTVKRTEAGMAAARARGKQIGAPIKFTDEKKAKALKWLRRRVKTSVVARRLGLSTGTISIFKKAKGL